MRPQTAETKYDRPPAHQDTVADAAPPTARTHEISSTTSRAPLEYMRADEIERTHTFALLGVIIFLGAMATVPLFEGHPAAKLAFFLCLVCSFSSNLWVIYITAKPERYSDFKIAAGWMVHTVTIAAALVHYGVFSPLPIITVLTIYFASLAYNPRLATAYYAICAATQAGISALIIGDVIDDPGLVHANYLSTLHQIMAQLLVQMVMAIAYVLARLSRRTTARKMAEMEAAVRAGAQREALLQEARMDLERALRVGEPGRFSGQVLGSYELGVVIGRGGMGEVYRAVHTKTAEPAAIKLLRRDVGDSGIIRRFLRELHVASTIRSPNVVRVYEIADDTSPLPYLAMELLSGHDLSHHLRAQRVLDSTQTIKLLREVGNGIDAAHGCSVVHRDLKPQNLFLAEQGAGEPIWKILDFGVSKLSEPGGTLTHGELIGTPVYMAPEQAQGKAVDLRVDIYALAAISYRVLTGHLPFRSRDIPATLHDVVYRMPVRPSALATLDEEIEAVLAIGMAKNPSDRFQTVGELVAALTAALSGSGPGLRRRANALLGALPWS